MRLRRPVANGFRRPGKAGGTARSLERTAPVRCRDFNTGRELGKTYTRGRAGANVCVRSVGLLHVCELLAIALGLFALRGYLRETPDGFGQQSLVALA